LNPFESVNIVESISDRTARHCWSGLLVGALPLQCLTHPSPSRTPPLTLAPRLVLTPPVSHARTSSAAPHRSTLLCDSAAAHTQWPGAIAGHLALLTAAPEAPSPPSASAMWPCPQGPLLFPLQPRTTDALEKPPAATRSLFSPFSSRPRPSSSSYPPFSIAYVSASPAPATRDPNSSMVPFRAPSCLPLHSETLPSTTVVPN
jgi:hypothetical protein